MKKLELLAPAGDLEKLKIAVLYGADAVYFGGEQFSLRSGAGNFTLEEMREGIAFVHAHGAKAHLTINIFAHNEDIAPLEQYLHEIKNLGIDAYIVSDPGIVMMIREIIPNAEIHLSTQANVTNYATANFWSRQGVKRIVLAREMSLREISELREKMQPDTQIEAFVHGAMCISYSGRCLLSNFMIQRDANRGMCAHPCRWKYALVEEQRPGQYYPIEEDERGTYIMNSGDLCMIEYIPDLIAAGVDSVKIEGRMKSVFYVATVVSAYRKAIDSYCADPGNYSFDPRLIVELEKASHRKFTTGFYLDKPTDKDQNYETSAYMRDYSFIGIVKSYDPQTGYAAVEQRNKMELGDEIEVFGPYTDFFAQTLEEMYDLETGQALTAAPHPQQMLKIKMKHPVAENFILRKRK